MQQAKIIPAGDSALVVEWGERIDEALNAQVNALAHSLEQAPLKGVVETVPTFRSLLVCYDPCQIGYNRLVHKLQGRIAALTVAVGSTGRVVEIPVCYGGEWGEDLPELAARAGLSEAEAVALHAGRDYLIYMLGFLPGFAYLGGLDQRLHSPRLATPRTRIPAGSVGIGGEQTGIYPLASPGGWRLIGRTPLRVYDPRRSEPVLYRAGDRIRFCPISPEEYAELSAAVEAGKL